MVETFLRAFSELNSILSVLNLLAYKYIRSLFVQKKINQIATASNVEYQHQ